MCLLRPRLGFFTLLASVLFGLAGCGGGGGSGGSSSDQTGGLTAVVLWEQPGTAAAAAARAAMLRAEQSDSGGFGPALPPSVRTVRFAFDADDGPDCCVAVDPDAVPVDPVSGQRLLVLTELPSGSARLTIAGFPVDFAPAPDGVTRTCTTRPAAAGRACDLDRIQTPSFL